MLGSIANLEVFWRPTLDEIAITLSIKEYMNLEEIVAACEKSGVHTKFIPDYNNMIPTIPFMEDLQGLPIIHIRHVPLTNMFNATMKRLVDIAGGCVWSGYFFAHYAGYGPAGQGDFSGTGAVQPGTGGTAQPYV